MSHPNHPENQFPQQHQQPQVQEEVIDPEIAAMMRELQLNVAFGLRRREQQQNVVNNDDDDDDNSHNMNNENENIEARQYHVPVGLPEERSSQSQSWSKIYMPANACIPAPRSGAASVVVKGKLYMFGGYGGDYGRLDDFYSYDFLQNTWSEVEIIPSSPKPGRRENNGVVLGDTQNIYLFGGYDGTKWMNDLWVFYIDLKKWECIQESSHQNNNDEQQDEADLATLRHRNPHSTRRANSNNGIRPSCRFGYVSVVHENKKLILFAGFDGTSWLNDTWEFDLHTKQWRQIQSKGQIPSNRSCPAWAKNKHFVYIHGGYDGNERKSDFFCLDLRDYTWTEIPKRGKAPTPRYFHSCVLYGNKLFAYGGFSGYERLADMYEFCFETRKWSQVLYDNQGSHYRHDSLNKTSFTSCCPSGRSSLVAQVYNNYMYVFGGYNGIKVLNDFYKFRLALVNVPPSTHKSDILTLLNNPTYSDCVFKLEDNKLVYANKCILSARSEYFRVMLYSGGMKESFSSSQQQPIQIEDVSHEVFLFILEYLYTDTIRSDISEDFAIQVLMASELFLLDRLKHLSQEILRTKINTQNVISMLLQSHIHNAIDLKEICLDFCLNSNNKSFFVEHPQNLQMLKQEPDLLLEIIHKLAVQREIEKNERSRWHRENLNDASSSRAMGPLER